MTLIKASSWNISVNSLSVWRKGDLVKLKNGKKVKLTSDGYFSQKENRVVCDTKDGFTIPYLTLIEEGYLMEDRIGRKNKK